MTRNPRVCATLMAVSCVCLPGTVHAHLMSSGVGPFYDGALHVLGSVDQILPLLAMCLLAGLRGKAPGRATLFGLPLALLVGAAAGRWGPAPASIGPASTVLLLALGGLVASDARLPGRVVILVATACGLLIGYANGTAMAEARLGVVALLGIATTGFAVAAFVTAFVVSLRAGWMRIAVRVAGSWMAALGLLMVAWSV